MSNLTVSPGAIRSTSSMYRRFSQSLMSLKSIAVPLTTFMVLPERLTCTSTTSDWPSSADLLVAFAGL